MKPRNTQLLSAFCALLLLTGCITSEDQSLWIKTSGANIGNIEQERAIAKNDCLAGAYEAFTENPMPNNNCIGNCSGDSGGFFSGFLAGRAARQSERTGEARQQFYNDCMIGKGWQRQAM